RPGDPFRSARARSDTAVERERELERDVWEVRRDELRPWCDERTRIGLLDADVDLDAVAREPLRASADDARVGIEAADDDARDACAEDGVHARRSAPLVVARLERHVERAAARGFAGLLKREDLCVLLARADVKGLTDDRAVPVDDDRSDRRVRRGH